MEIELRHAATRKRVINVDPALSHFACMETLISIRPTTA